MRVAIATCRLKPEPDPDEAPLLAALHEAGMPAELLAWDDPEPAALKLADLVLIRSTWNYFLEPERFLAWAEKTAAAARLFNSLAAIRWNIHKRYLLELESAGVPIVPTQVVVRGPAPDLGALRAARGWRDVVIKPAISAASFRTKLFLESEQAAGQAFLQSLCGHRDALVQPVLPGFAHPGERAHVWIAGEHTHCVHKQPRYAGEEERVSGALLPEPQERELMVRALAALPLEVRSALLYARLDLVTGPDGQPLVSELELLEPSLFLTQHPPALARLVGALV